jgi:dihydropyrimidine dehydrogenase (NAD+) subunit PreT
MIGKTKTKAVSGIRSARLSAAEYERNFADLHPPLTTHEALVEADRCYFCYEAPCQRACPTAIDIPLFIREIAASNPTAAARTILSANIFGGMCARVCPTETLCEELCVREVAEGKPVKIGMLQRYATDHLMREAGHPFQRAPATGKRIAVIGAGPAGLACAHRLAMLGHAVTLFEAKTKLGGLNEFGVAAYKSVDDFASREVEFILAIGAIDVKTGMALGENLDLAAIRREFDAVFIGIGLAGVNRLGLKGEDRLAGVVDAVEFIAKLRQAKDLSKLPIGRRVIVIGGGMTAIDAAVQSKRLGAEEVTIVYRRGAAAMKASGYERELAQTAGVIIRHFAVPERLHASQGKLTAVSFAAVRETRGKLVPTGLRFRLETDMVLTAIGQILVADAFGGAEVLKLQKGRIVTDAERRTGLIKVWAGGDCIAGGKDLTVTAVEDGKQAAHSIDRALREVAAAVLKKQ